MAKLGYYGVVSLTAVALFLVAGARSGETALPQEESLFPGAEVVTEGQLAQLRGGFSVPTLPSISFNFGINVTTTFEGPELPGAPTLSIETNLYFEDNGDSHEVPTNATVTSTATSTQNGGPPETVQLADGVKVDLSQETFTTTNLVKVEGGTLTIESNGGFGGINAVPDAGLSAESSDLVLLNSFNNSLIASVISNTLTGITVNQVTTVDIDLVGHEEFSKTLPSVGVQHMLHSIDHGVLMGLSN